jgi:flagellar motor switch protein FliG
VNPVAEAALELAAPDRASDAALMVMLLGDEQAADVLALLAPDELALLGSRMEGLANIGAEAVAAAVEDFVERIEANGLVPLDRLDQFRRHVTRAVGEVRADNLMRRIVPETPRASALEITRWLLPDAIVPLVRGEHPQTLAVLLVQLVPEVAAAVLHAQPVREQSDIVRRIATIGPVSPDAILMLEELLSRRIAALHGTAPQTMGGAREAASIINGAGKALEKIVLPEIARTDKPLARAIESEMFRFEHLFALDAMAMGTLLREIENDVLIDALKGLPEDQRQHFFKAMSARAAEGVADEIAQRGRMKLADAVIAQKRMIDTARRLAADGAIVFGAGGDDDFV